MCRTSQVTPQLLPQATARRKKHILTLQARVDLELSLAHNQQQSMLSTPAPTIPVLHHAEPRSPALSSVHLTPNLALILRVLSAVIFNLVHLMAHIN